MLIANSWYLYYSWTFFGDFLKNVLKWWTGSHIDIAIGRLIDISQWYIEVWLPGLITSVQVSILKRVQLIPLRLKRFKGGVDRLKRLKGNVDRGQVSTTSLTPPSQTFSDSSTNTWKRISVSLETNYIVIVGNTIKTVGQCETDKPE